MSSMSFRHTLPAPDVGTRLPGSTGAGSRDASSAGEVERQRVPAKANSYRRRWGWIAAIQHAIIQQLTWRFGLHICGIYTRPITAPPEPDPVVPTYSVRLYEPADVAELLAAAKRPELEISAEFVRKAFAKGDVCDAILHGGEIVSFGWSAFSPTHDHDGVFVAFGNNYRYGYFSYTLPEHRGLHLPRTLRPAKDRYCVSRGCDRSIAYISIDNRSSIRSSMANGSRLVGYAGYLKRGRLFIPFRTSGVRKVGFSFFTPESRSK